MSGLSPWLSGLSAESVAGGVPGEEAGEPAPGSNTGRLTSGSYAEAKQAQLETNLFETDNSNDQESSAGQELILEFLRKCKNIEASHTSDEAMFKEIKVLKKNLLQQDNNRTALVKVRRHMGHLLVDIAHFAHATTCPQGTNTTFRSSA
ncbi:hypothetical protein MSG28_009724 [Choristoneura fumiferana]|uniref:Uncharacterized protein n=1 Tax=Choristoneura fumiferana TaxID=7141 RepID=A0ACC0JCA3_CHOFU|nr:hypothetical protein MSG28_009724 [Choristoneura fumiferana]